MLEVLCGSRGDLVLLLLTGEITRLSHHSGDVGNVHPANGRALGHKCGHKDR